MPENSEPNLTPNHRESDDSQCDRSELLAAAIDAAKLGGEVLMRYVRDGVQMRDKSSDGGLAYDLVSDADIESEKCVGQYLQSKFPTHQLLGEENLRGQTDADDLWIIDPLDGTNNFAHGIPHFAVSIAYYHKGQPTVAAVLNPSRDELFTASLGGGAFLNGQPISVSEASSLSQAMLGCGFYYDRGEMMRRTLSAIEEFFGQKIHGIRRFGTASLDLCMVASGQLDGFFEYKLAPWDFAAGVLVVTEAGGTVTTADGAELPIGPTSAVVSNSKLHQSMTNIASKYSSPVT